MERHETVSYRLLATGDEREVLDLIRSELPPVFRVHGDRVYAAVIDDALASRDIMIALASKDGRLVGFSIIAWNWRRLKLLFALRHPIVGAAIAWSTLRLRVFGRRNKGNRDNTKRNRPRATTRGEGPGEPSWADGGPRVAKLVHTAVIPEYRRQGIAHGLKAFYVDVLRTRGFRRVDARINHANVASIAMQQRSGWVVQDDAHAVFAYLVIDDDGERG